MDKPQPTAEIIVTGCEHMDNMLVILCATERSRAWIASEAPTFGILTKISDAEYHLYVYAFYGIVEVGAYLIEGMPH